MAYTISDEQRKRIEKFIEQHPPYDDDAPELQCFDGDVDADRLWATTYKKLLEGKIP